MGNLKKFKFEFKDQIRMALTAAIGFTIAFSWRNTLFTLMQERVSFLASIIGQTGVNFAASISMTILGVILILITSSWLKN